MPLGARAGNGRIAASSIYFPGLAGEVSAIIFSSRQLLVRPERALQRISRYYRRCASAQACAQKIQTASTVNRSRRNSFLKSGSNVTRCSPNFITVAASQAYGILLDLIRVSRQRWRSSGHSATPAGMSTPEIESREPSRDSSPCCSDSFRHPARSPWEKKGEEAQPRARAILAEDRARCKQNEGAAPPRYAGYFGLRDHCPLVRTRILAIIPPSSCSRMWQ
jgi:hypothetical protein